MFKAVGAFSGFSVKDQKEAEEFYSNVLGLKVKDTNMGINIELPGGAEIFVYPKDNHEPATYTVLNLVVENIDNAVDALVAKGVTFDRYEGMPFTQDEKGVARGLAAGKGPDIAWFKDPAGNVLSILQEK